MTLPSLLAELKARGVTVQVDKDTLRVKPAFLLDPTTLELLRTHKSEIIQHLSEQPPIPHLHQRLKSLVRAAGSNLLDFNMQGIPDVNRYTLAWAAAYLTSDKDDALERLWKVHDAWRQQQVN